MREGHCTWRSLSRSRPTTFGDMVEVCKAGGEGTAKLTAKLGRATYVMDTGNLPPDRGCRTSGLGR